MVLEPINYFCIIFALSWSTRPRKGPLTDSKTANAIYSWYLWIGNQHSIRFVGSILWSCGTQNGQREWSPELFCGTSDQFSRDTLHGARWSRAALQFLLLRRNMLRFLNEWEQSCLQETSYWDLILRERWHKSGSKKGSQSRGLHRNECVRNTSMCAKMNETITLSAELSEFTTHPLKRGMWNAYKCASADNIASFVGVLSVTKC